jgi:two-component system sensor histidine kinase KdpD
MDTLSPIRPILVALGSEAQALRLIQAGFNLARERSAPWIGVYVDRGQGALTEDAEQVQVWMQEAQRLGATTLTVEAPTLAQGLAELSRRTGAQALVMGRSRDRWPWARLGHSTADELQRRGLAAELVILEEGALAPEPEGAGMPFGALLGTFLVLAACTGLAWLVPPEGSLSLVLPVYLLGVTLIAHRWGAALGILASVLSVLLYSFLLETPRFRQAASHWPNLLFFLLMLLAAQLMIGLLRRLRAQAREVQRRELHTASLYLLGRALARSLSPDEVAATASDHLRRVFKAQAWLLFPADGDWTVRPEPRAPMALPTPGELLPRLDLRERVGDPLEPLALGETIYLSLTSTDQSEGVLRILPRPDAPLLPSTWELLKAFAVQIALALGRLRWLEEARRAQLSHETERLRSTLLGAIGHDLRTPLAAIHGAASSLLLPGDLPAATQRDLLGMIQDESERLAHLLGNLLDLTRLESGALQVQKEWQPLEEVIGSALGRLERRSGPLPVRVELPADLPSAPFDAALMEQVLINLLGNAQRHAPGRDVDLRAWAEPGWLHLEVADRGPGLPEDNRERVFDKFFRLPGAGEGGVGLGLAICRAILQAHGGTIAAANRPGGGSVFGLALPLEGTPPPPPEGSAALAAREGP